ncbi:MAG TPA: hypothetical protein VFA30_04455 [Gaiellaceae bacterium]|nr:hypothetical protein [Gaiellaceae bacterium]
MILLWLPRVWFSPMATGNRFWLDIVAGAAPGGLVSAVFAP